MNTTDQPRQRNRLATGYVSLAAAFAGMFIGQAVRSRMHPDAFRRWFLIAMIFLGLYLVGSTIANLA